MYSFTRYLEAKRTVDDRALNERVWRTFWESCPASSRQWPLEVLELGAGTGTMIARIREAAVLTHARYTAVDVDPANAAALAGKLPAWLAENPNFEVLPRVADLHDLVAEPREWGWQVLIAHAFLDLFDLEKTLPAVLDLLEEGGIFYFSINFDGLTALEPAVDPGFDELVVDLYHRTMDERVVDGRPSGDSRSGRKLIPLLNQLGAEVVAAGSSDWIVYPRGGVYPADEAYFLHHILHFFESSLTGRPELDPGRFARWLAARRRQIEAGELVYIAHQIDITGKK